MVFLLSFVDFVCCLMFDVVDVTDVDVCLLFGVYDVYVVW